MPGINHASWESFSKSDRWSWFSVRIPVGLVQQDRQAHLSHVNNAACTQECENVDIGRGRGERQACKPALASTVSVIIDRFLSLNSGEGKAYGQKSSRVLLKIRTEVEQCHYT